MALNLALCSIYPCIKFFTLNDYRHRSWFKKCDGNSQRSGFGLGQITQRRPPFPFSRSDVFKILAFLCFVNIPIRVTCNILLCIYEVSVLMQNSSVLSSVHFLLLTENNLLSIPKAKGCTTEISFGVIWKILRVSCRLFSKKRCLKDMPSRRESDRVQFVQGAAHLCVGSRRG